MKKRSSKKKEKRKKTLAGTDNSMVRTRGKGVGEAEEGKGGQMDVEGDLTWGGEHTIRYTDDVL